MNISLISFVFFEGSQKTGSTFLCIRTIACHTTKDLEERIAIKKIGLSPAEITRAQVLLYFAI